ncbi:hypothetical protein C8T65DRAFT_741690 [Cerioporus squamosus]|nr:hypothetical protein C8T65DRAFT_741690 [Cerioporus squamosus]
MSDEARDLPQPEAALAAEQHGDDINPNPGPTSPSPTTPSSVTGPRGTQRTRVSYEAEDDDDSEHRFSSTSTPGPTQLRLGLVPPIPESATATLSLLAPSLKRARRLGIQSEADLDVFLAAGPLERSAYQYALELANHDQLTTLTLHLEYKLPGTLRSTCADYAWAYMLSPSVTSYRNADAADGVLAVMRDLNVSDLPPRHETGRCEEILRVIGKAMTACRHHMKDKIIETLDPKKKVARDIGSLSAAILSRSKVKPTAAFYIRAAYIRWVAACFPESGKDDNFWVKVDASMSETREEMQTSVMIQGAFMAIFDDDKAKYGAPDLLNSPPTEWRIQDDWIQQLHARASRPLSQSSGSSGLAPKPANTRRRARGSK